MCDGNGWDESAGAGIADLGESGDFGRRFILDKPMLARLEARRFCRMLQSWGIPTVGIDPTDALIRRARSLDADGDYRCTSYNTAAVDGVGRSRATASRASDRQLLDRARGMGPVARHSDSQLAPAPAYLRGAAAVSRFTTPVLRRTRAARRRPGKSRALPASDAFASRSSRP